MTPSIGIAERLRKAADQAGIILTDPPRPTPAKALMDEAADEIDRLTRERDERAEWAAAWYHTLETLATIHGLGILDRDEVIPAFGRYVDGLKDRAHNAEAEIDRLRAEIVAAREVCSLVRRQDYFDVPLPVLIEAQLDLARWTAYDDFAKVANFQKPPIDGALRRYRALSNPKGDRHG